MALISDPLRRRSLAVRSSFAKAPLAGLALGALVLLAGCSDLVDPGEYGGGAEGQAMAQCISRTEDDNRSITREEAASLCTCLNERIAEGSEKPISGGAVDRAENQRALLRCAADLGIEVG